ncbi:MAG: hypothetical protein KKF65_02520, partial [Nanoarchaeota archaeon]|nr:hypothetical protein [Nanoarchaeota archaeon]
MTRAVSNFWYEINPSCYSKTFKISCNKDFITNLLYKNKNSATIYVLENTQQSPQYGVTEHSVYSKCLGLGGSCDYEGTAWGAYALSLTGHEIDEFIPYLISSGETKKMYLPNAFIYLLTGYEDYGSDLIQQQKFGSYWEADSTVYNRYYDSALALLSLGINQEQTINAKNWLLYEQGTNGCWANSVRETAFILWVLLNRNYYVDNTATTVFCDDAGFYCINEDLCPEDDDIGSTYYCSGTTKTCCKTLNLESCLVMGGGICPSGEVCRGLVAQASDTTQCCLAGCEIATEETSECESSYYNCYSECGDGYESVDYNCNNGMVCCSALSDDSGSGLPWWIWLLIILIILVILAIIFIYRDKIKERFSRKGSEEEEKRPIGMPPRRPGMPPRPGM